jgi:tRNA-2-methylthio-N6-dimethylallyladenosine synthase
MSLYHIWTVGCQMNKAESEKLSRLLESAGHIAAGCIEEAGLVVVNSCIVRQHAEDRVVNKLHYLRGLKNKNPGMILAVTGCLVGDDRDALKQRVPFIDHFFGPGETPEWLSETSVPAAALRASPTVYILIIQGCNNF